MEQFITEYAVWAFLAVFIIEFILGKTKVVKSNSTVEIVLRIIAAVAKKAFNLQEKDEPGKLS